MTAEAHQLDQATSDAAGLTEVDIAWYKGRIEHWIRFGREAEERIIDRRRRVVCFAPGSVFAVIRWASNDFGTARSDISILRAVSPGEAYSTEPQVRPGAEILLRLSSWRRVHRVLMAIDNVEALGVEAHDVAPDHWRHVMNRLSAGQTARPYTTERHRAWLLRKALRS